MDPSPSPEDLLLSRERSKRISEAIRSLPANQRMAMVLKRYDDRSYEEIARILGCSVSAVESLGLITQFKACAMRSAAYDRLKNFRIGPFGKIREQGKQLIWREREKYEQRV